MFGIDDAIIGSALISGLGSFIGGERANSARSSEAEKLNAFNAAQAERQMQFQRESQQTQMDFQERMSSSAYQRAMQDMRAAGLNPMLAYSQGGASSPAGSAMSGSAASGAMPTIEDTITPAVHGAMRAAQVLPQIEATKAQAAQSNTSAALNEKLAAKAVEDTLQSQANTAYLKQQTITDAERARLIPQQAAEVMTRSNLNVASAKTEEARQGLLHADTYRSTVQGASDYERYRMNRDFGFSSSSEWADFVRRQAQHGLGGLSRALEGLPQYGGPPITFPGAGAGTLEDAGRRGGAFIR